MLGGGVCYRVKLCTEAIWQDMSFCDEKWRWVKGKQTSVGSWQSSPMRIVLMLRSGLRWRWMGWFLWKVRWHIHAEEVGNYEKPADRKRRGHIWRLLIIVSRLLCQRFKRIPYELCGVTNQGKGSMIVLPFNVDMQKRTKKYAITTPPRSVVATNALLCVWWPSMPNDTVTYCARWRLQLQNIASEE